ncbi:NINE protein [Corynebacterium sp. S7]
MSTPNGGNNYEHNPFDRPQSNQPYSANQGYQGSQGYQDYQGYQQAPYQQPPYQAYNEDGLPVQPQFNQQYGFQPQQARPKSKVVAAVLAFFLGSLGLHNFYLGYNNRGIAQLVTWVVALITTFAFFGLLIYMVLGVWVFVEFILILIGGGKYKYDSRGIELE